MLPKKGLEGRKRKESVGKRRKGISTRRTSWKTKGRAALASGLG